MQINSFPPPPVNIAFPLFPAALAIFSSLTPLFSLLHIRLCLRVLTQSRWLGKHVKNLSPVSATFEAPSPFFSFSPLKFHHKVIFAKYPVNSIKVICFPFSSDDKEKKRAQRVECGACPPVIEGMPHHTLMCNLKSIWARPRILCFYCGIPVVMEKMLLDAGSQAVINGDHIVDGSVAL